VLLPAGEGDAAREGIAAAEWASIAQRLEEMQQKHSTALDTFRQQIPSQAHDSLRFLLFRL
jgi:hypothetical protein